MSDTVLEHLLVREYLRELSRGLHLAPRRAGAGTARADRRAPGRGAAHPTRPTPRSERNSPASARRDPSPPRLRARWPAGGGACATGSATSAGGPGSRSPSRRRARHGSWLPRLDATAAPLHVSGSGWLLSRQDQASERSRRTAGRHHARSRCPYRSGQRAGDHCIAVCQRQRLDARPILGDRPALVAVRRTHRCPGRPSSSGPHLSRGGRAVQPALAGPSPGSHPAALATAACA